MQPWWALKKLLPEPPSVTALPFPVFWIPSHKLRALYILQRQEESLLGRFLVQNQLFSAPSEGSKRSAKGDWLKALQRNILLSKINRDLGACEACRKKWTLEVKIWVTLQLGSWHTPNGSAVASACSSFLLLCQSFFWVIHELKMAPVAPNLSATFKGRKQCKSHCSPGTALFRGKNVISQ